MAINDIYYLQVNLICIILLVITLLACFKSRSAAYSMTFQLLFIEGILYCVFDILVRAMNGKMNPGFHELLYILKSICIMMPVLFALTWNYYITMRLAMSGYRRVFLDRILMVIAQFIAAFTLLSPVTGLAFSIDENNVYQPRTGAAVPMIVSLLYILYATLRINSFRKTNPEYTVGERIKAMSLFIIPPFAAALIQLLSPEITVLQVGLTLGLLVAFIMDQGNQITRDELTGMNNRREYERYLSGMKLRAKSGVIAIADMDNFKMINERYGKIEGDRVLCEVADVLRHVVGRASCGLFLARLESDKFMILGIDPPEMVERLLLGLVAEEVTARNVVTTAPYKISITLGIAHGPFNTDTDAAYYLKEAEKKVGEEKQRMHSEYPVE